MKSSGWVAGAVVAGIAGGAAIAASGSPVLLHAADRVAPVGTLWVNAIRMTVIPLVVSLLVTGVASVSDLRDVGRIGGRTLLVFLGLLAAVAVVFIPAAGALAKLLPAIGARPPLPAGAAEAAAQVTSSRVPTGFGAWLVSLVPTNPVASAADGAMLPLIVFTLLLALAIARSPARSRATLVGFFEALADAMLVLVRWVVAAAPVGVFALLLPLAAHAGVGLAGAVVGFIVLYSAACVTVIALLYPVAAGAGRTGFGGFTRAALPAQLIALSTSSSIATLPVMVEGCEDGLGISERVTGFVLPLAVSIFHVAAPVSWTMGALFVGWFYGIPVGPGHLAIVGVAAVFLAAASPGVPRGGFLMLAPLFLAIGLPIEGIGLLIAVDAIPDVFATTLNATGDMVAAALVARWAGAEEMEVATALTRGRDDP